MDKKQTSIRINNDTWEFLTHVAELTNSSRSRTVDLLAEIAKDYFEDSMFKAEFEMRGLSIDGRTKKV